MKILFLSDNFPPEINAPASRTYDHCLEWTKMGHDVTVITCVPNFPKGKVFDGYKNKIFQEEQINGIRVIRVWSFISANEGFLLRVLDYVSFMFSAILASFFVKNADLVIGTSPQFFTACAAYVVSKVKKIPFVFEVRDIWPESIKAVGAMSDSFLIRMLERIELFLYRNSQKIIVVTKSFKKTLINRGVASEKIEIVTNGVDLSRFVAREKCADLVTKHNLQAKFVVGYIGTHGMAHGLQTLLDAAVRLGDKPDGVDIFFLFLGDGAEKGKLKEYAKSHKLDNVLFIDSVPKNQVVNYWSLLDVSIIHLKRTPLFQSVIPSKIFESMSMGIPIALGVEGESAEIITEEDVGLVFEPENTQNLIDILIKLKTDDNLYKKLGVNCKKAAKKYDRTVLAHNMLKILIKLGKKDET